MDWISRVWMDADGCVKCIGWMRMLDGFVM